MPTSEQCGIEYQSSNALTAETSSWRVADSLQKLLDQINQAAPARSKISDGSIGDTSHSNRASDHNPWCGPGVVTARDFTHDSKAGADMDKMAEALRKSRDPRIKYVIWNRRIFSSTVSPWTWRAYTGSNPHDKHMHVSVVCAGFKDSTTAWKVAVAKPRNKFRVTATKVRTRTITGGKIARAWAALMRGRGFKTEIKEL